MSVFFTFQNTRIWWTTYNQAVALRITRPICTPLFVTIIDVAFRKIWAFMIRQTSCWNGLVRFWRKLRWFLFVGYMIVEIQVTLLLTWNFAKSVS